MSHASTRVDAPVSAAVQPSHSIERSAVQLRTALRGQDFERQENALAPIQMKAQRGLAPSESPGPARAERPVQRRRIHPLAPDPMQMMHAEHPVQMMSAEHPVQMHADPVQMRGGKAAAYYDSYTLDGTGVSDRHMFEGEGGDTPKGLHSYAGGMANVVVLATIGNTNSVHVIVWTWAANTAKPNPKCKWSSMFPQDMSKGMVSWYVKRYCDRKSTDGLPNEAEGRPGTGYQGITLRGAGDTVYPLCGTLYSSAPNYVANGPGGQGEGVTHGGKFYKIANPGA